MNKVTLLLSVSLLINSLFLLTKSCNDANNILRAFGIITTPTIPLINLVGSGTTLTVSITLLHDGIIYKCNVNPTDIDTRYLCQDSIQDSIEGYGCTGINENEMFVELNINPDVTEIDDVRIGNVFYEEQVSGASVGEGFCLGCGSNTALINFDMNSVSTDVTSYSYTCSRDNPITS